MKFQKGFTLIELMVVIVIIGILSALAIPKMFGVSAKAKAAEAPGVLANFETLESAYSQETGAAGADDLIGFTAPTGSMWWMYSNSLAAGTMGATAALTAETLNAFGSCAAMDQIITTYTAATDASAHTSAGGCRAAYLPNF